MRFGDFIWPHNPKIYEIEYKRRIVCHKVPFGLYTLSDLGRDVRILRGEGEFVGENAYSEFKKLAAMFYCDKPQVLVHPIWQSSPAWFVSLKLKQEPRRDYVKYEFEFWECFEGYELSAKAVLKSVSSVSAERSSVERRTYTIKSGDTLWGLAKSNGLSLTALLALNPQIRNPNIYYCGDVVYLS
ncbi:MAG: LysM peptidoglycan-binding domain-containing protein [Oscillospiraceae bacterium]|nr:LysM peptidoglycan-binding domain-containing protein [Oscillospiraceae bacterium]